MSSPAIVDLAFSLRGEAIAADYAQRLWDGLRERLSWLDEEPAAGVHPIAGVSGSGGEVVYLNRRARLMLRLPEGCVEAARALVGTRLDLDGEVVVGDEAGLRPIARAAVLYASFVCVERADELEFLEECRHRLEPMVAAPQMVCGKARKAASRDGLLQGFSLMLHGLGGEESLALQRAGLGGQRRLGCGLFVPHKAVAAVGE